MPKPLQVAVLAFSMLGPSVAAPPACTARQAEGPDARPVQEPNPVEVADPMANFARMVGGEWKMMAAAGTELAAGSGLYETWHWGPGKHSVRVMTDGIGGDGKPWREIGVVYWHPGRKEIRLLELSTYRAGVAEGTIKFEGETSESIIDMYQTGDHRKLKSRWTFEGPDKYRDELLESTGAEDFPLAAWNRHRIAASVTPRPRAVAGAELPEHLRVFEPLLNHAWQTAGGAEIEWAPAGASPIRSTFEWVPLANGIFMHTLASAKDGRPTHLLDAYIYHHTGTNALRCLALSNQGGVYEGDLAVLDGGALQLDLKGYQGDRIVQHITRFDFEEDGAVRHRVFSLKGTGRTLILDIHHNKPDPK